MPERNLCLNNNYSTLWAEVSCLLFSLQRESSSTLYIVSDEVHPAECQNWLQNYTGQSCVGNNDSSD